MTGDSRLQIPNAPTTFPGALEHKSRAGQIEYIGEEKTRGAEVSSDSARVEGFKSRRVGELESRRVGGRSGDRDSLGRDKLAGMFHFGKSWYTPGSFRKSGTQWTYGIRNLEECVSR